MHSLIHSIQLCRVQYDENLLCRHDFLRQCLILYQKAVHLNQLPALIYLMRSFLDEYYKARYLTKQLVNLSIMHFQKVCKMYFSNF